MLIFRRFGFLGAFPMAGGFALADYLAKQAGLNSLDDRGAWIWLLCGMLFAAAGCGLLGWLLNIYRPRRQARDWADRRRSDLAPLVAQGQFRLPPPAPAPTSVAEAQAQMEQLVAEQHQTMLKALSNRDSLFFIPLQWFGAVFGTIFAVGSLIARGF